MGGGETKMPLSCQIFNIDLSNVSVATQGTEEKRSIAVEALERLAHKAHGFCYYSCANVSTAST